MSKLDVYYTIFHMPDLVLADGRLPVAMIIAIQYRIDTRYADAGISNLMTIIMHVDAVKIEIR